MSDTLGEIGGRVFNGETTDGQVAQLSGLALESNSWRRDEDISVSYSQADGFNRGPGGRPRSIGPVVSSMLHGVDRQSVTTETWLFSGVREGGHCSGAPAGGPNPSAVRGSCGAGPGGQLAHRSFVQASRCLIFEVMLLGAPAPEPAIGDATSWGRGKCVKQRPSPRPGRDEGSRSFRMGTQRINPGLGVARIF